MSNKLRLRHLIPLASGIHEIAYFLANVAVLIYMKDGGVSPQRSFGETLAIH